MKLLSTTILAAGAIAVAGAAYADNSGRKEIEITPAHKIDPYKPVPPHVEPHFDFHPLHTEHGADISNVQINENDVVSKMDIDVYDYYYRGDMDITATSAAIGNSFSLEFDGGSHEIVGDVLSYQFNRDDVYANGSLYSKIDDIETLEFTVAGIGNSVSIEMDDVNPPKNESIFDVWNEQIFRDGGHNTIEAYGYIDAKEIDETAATVAAIANSASIELEDVSTAYRTARVGNVQDNDAQYIEAELIFDVKRAEEMDLTVAAIGNSFSLEMEDLGLNGAGVMNSQVNKSDYLDAFTYIDAGSVEELTTVTAAIGNTASITADDPIDLDIVSSAQKNLADVYAEAYITAVDNGNSNDVLDSTVAAIGNSLAIEVTDLDNDVSFGGDIVASQVNHNHDTSAILDLYSDNLEVVSTVAAIGNSISIELVDRKEMDMSMFQHNMGDLYAYGKIDAYNAVEVESTVAALGNSLSIDVNGDHNRKNAYGDIYITQVNLGEGYAKQVVDLTGDVEEVSVTTAAIGNSASLNLSGDFFDGVKSAQVNHADMTAKTYVDFSHGAAYGHTAVDVTTAAIGNSLSITVK